MCTSWTNKRLNTTNMHGATTKPAKKKVIDYVDDHDSDGDDDFAASIG